MNLFEKIELIRPTFTKTDQAISEAMKENYTLIFQNSSNSLAKLLGFSQASIMRYCRRLGYSRYNEFRFAVQEALQSENSSSDSFSKEDGYKKLISLISTETQQGSYDEFLLRISKSRLTYVYGKHRSSLPAQLFALEMQMRGKNCIYVEEIYAEQWNANLTSEDTVVLFSETGSTFRQAILTLNEQENKPVTYILCMNAAHPLIGKFDHSILIPNSTTQGMPVAIDSSAVFSIFVDFINTRYTFIHNGQGRTENENL